MCKKPTKTRVENLRFFGGIYFKKVEKTAVLYPFLIAGAIDGSKKWNMWAKTTRAWNYQPPTQLDDTQGTLPWRSSTSLARLRHGCSKWLLTNHSKIILCQLCNIYCSTAPCFCFCVGHISGRLPIPSTTSSCIHQQGPPGSLPTTSIAHVSLHVIPPELQIPPTNGWWYGRYPFPYHPWDWYIYPHLVDFYGINVGKIYHAWIVWDWLSLMQTRGYSIVSWYARVKQKAVAQQRYTPTKKVPNMPCQKYWRKEYVVVNIWNWNS